MGRQMTLQDFLNGTNLFFPIPTFELCCCAGDVLPRYPVYCPERAVTFRVRYTASPRKALAGHQVSRVAFRLGR